MFFFGKNKETVIDYFVYTNKGGREINEDSCDVFVKDGVYCCVLCDGLGGHDKGEVASQTVLKSFKDDFEKYQGINKFISKSFDNAQEELMQVQKSGRERYGMKTTGVALVIDGKSIEWGYVGDSRLYGFEDNKIKFRTLDHSVPQILCNSGEITEKDIRFHPDRNKLLKVMGSNWEHPMYETSGVKKLKGYTAFLLCTDGFWELIDEEEMCVLLKESNTSKEWIEKMVKVVEKRGVGKNMDNYSAIGVFINGKR